VINAVFNFRNFWDGRASNVFNGADPFGARNPNALVWKLQNNTLSKVQVRLPSSSLASQASGPPLSGMEMSCANRAFVQLAQKLVNQPILANQTISPTDSVLGKVASRPPTYKQLIAKAFQPSYWQAPSVRVTGGDKQVGSMDLVGRQNNQKLDLTVSQMESNFELFFSLAIQLYGSTLVSDDTRFDQFAAGDSTKLNANERAGFEVFKGKGRCMGCHSGAEFTSASFSNVLSQRLERMDLRSGATRTYDTGFYNIGVRPTHEDLGLGGRDPFGKPMAESMVLAESDVKDAAAAMLGNSFETWKYIMPSKPSDVNVAGAFKTPGLRNVELTGPYFHNGGKATLMQVVDLYDRGGDFGRENGANIHTSIVPLGLTEQEKRDLVGFLLALTDERVRYARAPFDHPSICLPQGHPDSAFLSPSASVAPDYMTCMDAVGAAGRPTPLKPFLELSPFER
jgi:cytochrome c peroxidase